MKQYKTYISCRIPHQEPVQNCSLWGHSPAILQVKNGWVVKHLPPRASWSMPPIQLILWCVEAGFLAFPVLDQFMRMIRHASEIVDLVVVLLYLLPRCFIWNHHPERRCLLPTWPWILLGTGCDQAIWHHKAQQLKQFGKELPTFLLLCLVSGGLVIK